MNAEDYTIRAIDGTKLAARRFQVPSGTLLKAKIVYVHGFAEHRDVYNDWWPAFAQAGYEVTLFDQRGHGHTARDSREFGLSNDYYAFKDLDSVIQHTLRNNNHPAFLWGHSMGGGIVLTYMVRGKHRERFGGFIANSPYVKSNRDTDPGFKGKLLPFLHKIAPQYREKIDLGPERCTNDPSKYDLYREDPLRHNIGSVDLVHGMVVRGKDLLVATKVAEAVDRPLLLCHGDEDRICDYGAAKKAFDLFPSLDKTFLTYEGMPHELMQLKKEDSDAHRADVLKWLDSHLWTAEH